MPVVLASQKVSVEMTHPMELVERLDAYRPTNEWGDPVHHVIIDEAAACIRELVDQRDQARAVITDTCAKASWMEPLAGDDVTKETIALVASRCRAFEQMAALAPADRGGGVGWTI